MDADDAGTEGGGTTAKSSKIDVDEAAAKLGLKDVDVESEVLRKSASASLSASQSQMSVSVQNAQMLQNSRSFARFKDAKLSETKRKLSNLVATLTDIADQCEGQLLDEADAEVSDGLLDLLEQSDRLRKLMYPPHPALRKATKPL